jgi:hypothetical protein
MLHPVRVGRSYGYPSTVRAGGKLGGPSPFLTERARVRAPQVIEYAAVMGAAALVSPDGEIVLVSGLVADLDLGRLARTTQMVGAAKGYASFQLGDACVHAGPVRDDWTLCVVSLSEVAPAVVAERLRKAAHVLALALVDGIPPGAGGAHGPASAEVFVVSPRRPS